LRTQGYNVASTPAQADYVILAAVAVLVRGDFHHCTRLSLPKRLRDIPEGLCRLAAIHRRSLGV
jgi:hypothetical protein